MIDKAQQAPRVALLTLGCAKNEADSRAMRNRLESQGYTVCEQAEDATFIVLNTCAFIEAAIEESLDAILELVALERIQSGEAKLLVAGCLPSRFGDDLVHELPEVAAFVPIAKEADIVEVLEGLTTRQGEPREPSAQVSPSDDHVATLQTEHHDHCNEQPWAYVKISDGCSRHCSYCTIPLIRGPYHNYSFETINTEIRDLVKRGVREIILVGQDTGLWRGSTSENSAADGAANSQKTPRNLAELLAVLAQEYPQTWFRVMYLQPEGITDELLEVMGLHPNIARYLDIPLQHASARIIASMNRRGSGEGYLELLQHIREALPDVVLRTTVIVGYPGESPEEFEELYDFIVAARFNYVGIFAYSREEGTEAASLPGQIDQETARERLQHLRDAADTVGFELAEEQIGREVAVLICGQEEDGVFGRTKGQAPEVDGITVFFDSVNASATELATTSLKPGTFVHAQIVETVLYDVFVEVTTGSH